MNQEKTMEKLNFNVEIAKVYSRNHLMTLLIIFLMSLV